VGFGIPRRAFWRHRGKQNRVIAIQIGCLIGSSPTFQYILTHVIKKMGEVGVRSATFGAGAASELHRVDNIGGFKVVTLEKAYNGISSTFHLGNKGDFRSKFGTQQDPVRRLFSRSSLHHWFLTFLLSAIHLLSEGRSRCEGH